MNPDFESTVVPALESLLTSQAEQGPVQTESISYASGGVEFGGFVARPATAAVGSAAVASGAADASSGSPASGALLPAVLIISDWSGLNDHARVRAVMLARLGYIALAGDVYGGGVELAPDKAGAAAGQFYGDPELFRERMRANLEHLRGLPGVDTDRIAVMGYCFGGSASLELARSGAELAGVVSFHGNLRTGLPATPGAVRAPILVLTGGSDPVVPDDSVVAFENELREAGAADWQVVTYSGAMHAFTMPMADSPDHGAQFDARANARSWQAMRTFLSEVFA